MGKINWHSHYGIAFQFQHCKEQPQIPNTKGKGYHPAPAVAWVFSLFHEVISSAPASGPSPWSGSRQECKDCCRAAGEKGEQIQRNKPRECFTALHDMAQVNGFSGL